MENSKDKHQLQTFEYRENIERDKPIKKSPLYTENHKASVFYIWSIVNQQQLVTNLSRLTKFYLE